MTKYLSNQLPDNQLILQNGEEYLWFSGTDYLGMGHNESFQSYLVEGLKIYGTHFGSSRNNSLQLNIYNEAEIALAEFTGAPAALTVSSGMWAGQLVLREIENIILNQDFSESTRQIKYHYSPGVHPAIWGKDYAVNSKTWSDWAYETIQLIGESTENVAHVICSDAVGSPWVNDFDFSIFDNLPSQKNIQFIVDDSHGLGVCGRSGNGIYQKIAELKNAKVIVVASLNKAMGIPAGTILADESIIARLRNSPWFSGASPCAPAYIFAFKKLLDANLYQKAYEHLLSSISYFQNQISGIGIFSAIKNYPVFCSRDISLFPFLLDHGIMASRFSYPLSTDPPVTRLAISTLHQKEDLDRLAEVCIEFQKR